MAELEKSLESLASVQEKLSRGNAAAASKAEAVAAKQLESNQSMEKRLEALIASAKAGNRTNEQAEKKLADLQLNMRITADKAEATAKWEQSSAGQAVALKKELESLGHKAEDNKNFSRLTYKAAQADLDARLAAPGLSKSARKEIKEEKRNLAKKDGNRLEKIAAGIGGLFGLAKKGLKTAALGGMALLSTLAIGGLMMALGEFLQSDDFKVLTKYIQDTVIPKLKVFGASLKNGMQKLITLFSGTDKDGNPVSMFDRITGIFNKDSALVVGLIGIVALFGAAKLLKLFGPLKGAIGGLLKGIGGLASRIPGIKKIPGISKVPKAPAGPARGAGPSKITKVASNIAKVGVAAGKGIGGFIGGILKGIASGLAAIANPLTLVGLAAVVLAVNGIALAIRIMSPAFEPIGKMFESFGETVKTVFEGLGGIIKSIGESISGVITAIGDSIGNIIDKITSMKTAGTDATTKQIKELSAIPGNLMLETAKGIDAIKAALDGFGGGTFSKIAGSLFGGSGPIDKIIKLSEKVPALMKASEAIAILGAAGSDFAKAETEIERRKEVAELKERMAGSYRIRRGTKEEDQAKLAELEGQAMPMGGPSNIAGKVAAMKHGPGLQKLITTAINAADLTLIEKERMKREAEFKTAGLTTTGQQVFNQDNRQSSNVTTTGQSGNNSLNNSKLKGLTKGAAAG